MSMNLYPLKIIEIKDVQFLSDGRCILEAQVHYSFPLEEYLNAFTVSDFPLDIK
jgi:hypothetical protein